MFMCDVGQVICERFSVALLQKPYVKNGQLRVLPLGMRTFLDIRGLADILINDLSINCVLVDHLTDEYGVCVLLKCIFGEYCVYCKFNQPIQPYIEYLDRVEMSETKNKRKKRK